MSGFKLASVVCGITLFIIGAVYFLVTWLTSWLGLPLGGWVSAGVVFLAAFLAIGLATREN